MEHLEEIFRKNGRVYDGTDKMVQDLFFSAVCNKNEETMKALIFPGSPVLSAVLPLGKLSSNNSFLHFLTIFTSPNMVIAQLLIDCGLIDHQNSQGNTVLHLCILYYSDKDSVENSKSDMVKLLLKNGANRDIRNENGLTPLQLSLFSGNLKGAEEFLKEEDKIHNVFEVNRAQRCRHLVKCLLQERNDWNVSGTNYSILLHFLTLENDEEIFDYVAKNTKFDLSAVNHDGNMLLHLVAKHGTARMIRTLINMGADPEVPGSTYFGTPLIIGIMNSQTEVFNCLLDCRASVHTTHQTKNEVTSPLHVAVAVQNLEIVEKLVKLGADVNALTYHRSPLLIACGSIRSKKWPSFIVKGYLNFVEISNIFSRNVRELPFNVKIVEFLLDHGADIEVKNASNRTALDQACKIGRLDMVKLLLSRGAKINQGDVSTLHHAVRGENPAVVKLILKQGADVNYRCAPEKILSDNLDYEIPPSRTPLECALHFIVEDSNCKDIVEVLIEYGVNLNITDPEGESPLHLACLSNETEISVMNNPISRPATVALLLKHNANVNVLNSASKQVPLFYALRNYFIMTFADTTEISSNPFKPVLVTLIAFIARMIEKKKFLMQQNFSCLQVKSITRKIYKDCVNEISLMQKNICDSRNFSFSDILSKPIECLGSVLKNKRILQVLNSCEYKKKFPIYAEYLEDRIQEATVRQQLTDLAVNLFHEHVNKEILVELRMNIFKFLTLHDLKKFAKACFVGVKLK